MAQGPEDGAQLLLPGDPLASGARESKTQGLPVSLAKGFSPHEVPRRGLEGQFSIFDKKIQQLAF